MKSKVLRNVLIQVLTSLLIFSAYFYSVEYSKARDFNNFLERASSISSLHSENTDEFEKVLDFSDTSRDEFEKKGQKIQKT